MRSERERQRAQFVSEKGQLKRENVKIKRVAEKREERRS